LNPPYRPYLLLALCVAVPVAAVLWLSPSPVQRPTVEPAYVASVEATPVVAESEPLAVERFFIGQGGTLAAACERAGLEPELHREVLAIASRHLDLRRLSPRTGIAVSRDPEGRPVSLAIRSESDRFLRVTLPGATGALRAELLPLTVQTRVETAGGVISSSVAQALGRTANSHILTQAYADIFQWDVDLLVDPRPGDQVKVVYEVETLGAVSNDLPRFGDAAVTSGDFVGLGRILAATYQGSIAEATAFWVEDGGFSGDYYDTDGRPLRKSFLKSPLNYRRISSGFSRARRHPVTRRVVPHHGIDFAAAPGTPVTATADGRVVSAGWDGPLGQAVRLRHGSEYITIYGHLRGFARGISAGVDIKQGQVIGYVGSTGRATGPHLHYTVLQNGRAINPMKMNNPTVEPLEDRLLPWLAESRRRYQPVLEAIHAEPQIDMASAQPTDDPNEIVSGM